MANPNNDVKVDSAFRNALIASRERFLYLLNVPEACTRDEEKLLRPLSQFRKKTRIKCCPPMHPVSFELKQPFMSRAIGIHSEKYTDEIEDLIRSGFAIPKGSNK